MQLSAPQCNDRNQRNDRFFLLLQLLALLIANLVMQLLLRVHSTDTTTGVHRNSSIEAYKLGSFPFGTLTSGVLLLLSDILFFFCIQSNVFFGPLNSYNTPFLYSTTCNSRTCCTSGLNQLRVL